MSVYGAEFLKHIREHLSILGKLFYAECHLPFNTYARIQMKIRYPLPLILMVTCSVAARRVSIFSKRTTKRKRKSFSVDASPAFVGVV